MLGKDGLRHRKGPAPVCGDQPDPAPPVDLDAVVVSVATPTVEVEHEVAEGEEGEVAEGEEGATAEDAGEGEDRPEA